MMNTWLLSPTPVKCCITGRLHLARLKLLIDTLCVIDTPFLMCFLCSQVSASCLFSLNGLEQGLEVSSSESFVAPSLDHFQEQGRPVLQRPRKDLQEVALLVIVDEDLVLLQDGDVLLDIETHLGGPFSDHIVVGVRDLIQELDSSCLHPLHCLDDVVSPHGDVLDSRTTIVLHILLDLTLPDAVSWLIDGHLDLLVEVRHNH